MSVRRHFGFRGDNVGSSSEAFQRVSVSALQRVSVSACQRFSASAYQRVSASARQRFSVSAFQRVSVAFQFGFLVSVSALFRGIGSPGPCGGSTKADVDVGSDMATSGEHHGALGSPETGKPEESSEKVRKSSENLRKAREKLGKARKTNEKHSKWLPGGVSQG